MHCQTFEIKLRKQIMTIETVVKGGAALLESVMPFQKGRSTKEM